MEHQVNSFAECRGDKLKLVRVAIGLSYEELAEKIDKTKQFVSKLGKRCRSSEQCLELVFSAPMTKSSSPLTERKYALGNDVCHFRSKKPRTQTLANSVLTRTEIPNIIISTIGGEIEFPDVNMPEHPGAELLTPNDIEQVVEDCRRAWDLSLGPISSTAKLAESLGITVAHVMGIDDHVDAFTVHNNRPIIIRNNVKKSIYRLRSDLGHELGHLVMHEDITTGDKLMGSQTGRLSSILLVPRLSSIKEFPRIRGKQFDRNALVKFKPRWKISLKMCIYRANALGLLIQEQTRIGYIHLNSRGYTGAGPGNELLRPEEPGVLAEAIEMLDDATWLRILMKTGLNQNLIRKLPSINRPITNPRDAPQIV